MYWEGFPGNWTGSGWEAEYDSGEGEYIVGLDATNDWNIGFRPIKARITLDTTSIDRISISDYEDNDLAAEEPAISETEIELTFFGDSTSNDIRTILARNASSIFEITKIEFAIKVCSSSSSSSSSSSRSSSSSSSSSSRSSSSSSRSSSSSSKSSSFSSSSALPPVFLQQNDGGDLLSINDGGDHMYVDPTPWL